MPPQYPQNPQITDMDREAAKILRGMLQAQAKLDGMGKTNVPQGYALVRETPDGGKIYRKPDGQLTFTSSGYGTNNQAEIQRMIQGMAPGQARRAETNKQIVEQDGVRGAAASAIKGLPFIGEYFDEAVGMMTGDPRTTAALRETTNAYQEQRPLETFGLQMGLGTAVTLPLVPFQAVGNALKAAPTMGRAMLGGLGVGAAAGATEGAVAGFGAGEGTAEQRLPSAQTGAVIGGALGGALGAAAAPVEAGVRSVMQNWLKSVPPNVLEAPAASLQNAEKILTDFRVARELSDEQLAPVADAINTEMRRLQTKTVEVNGERIPYSNTSEGYDRVMRLNALLMNAFKSADGEIDIAKAMRWAEKNDPDRAMRVEAGRAVNDLQDGVRRPKPAAPGVKPPPVKNGAQTVRVYRGVRARNKGDGSDAFYSPNPDVARRYSDNGEIEAFNLDAASFQELDAGGGMPGGTDVYNTLYGGSPGAVFNNVSDHAYAPGAKSNKELVRVQDTQYYVADPKRLTKVTGANAPGAEARYGQKATE
jgi:hypothetical protein